MSITTRPWNGCGPKPPVASLTERFPTVHCESDGPLQHVSLRRCICCLRSNVRTSVPLGQVCISEMSRVAKGWTTNADQTRCRRLLVTLPPSREGVAPEGTSQRFYPRSPFLSKDDGLPPRNRWRCWRARCSSEMQVERMMTSVKTAEAPVHPGQRRPPRKEGKGHTRTSAPVVVSDSFDRQSASR
jgi:hypothetical protein